jgi:purine nucleoside phosphorylase
VGVWCVVFTHAAGSLLPELRPGHLVAADTVHIWLYARWDLPEAVETDFLVPGCDYTGACYWMHGPCYETRAEIAALRRLGAAAVGMSIAPELVRCRELGMRAGVISCVTNQCGSAAKLTHDHVLETARAASDRLCAILRNWLKQDA